MAPRWAAMALSVRRSSKREASLRLGPSGSVGTLTVAGNLAFQSGAMYVVGVTPSVASATNVGGTASLAGTVQANFGAGTFLEHSYTILTATRGRSGTFDALATSGLPADFKTSLTYPGNTVVLNLTAQLIPPTPPTPTPPTPPRRHSRITNVMSPMRSITFLKPGGRRPSCLCSG